MLDLDLLHSFVSVVDAGGFTAAGERVHRSQSTVSQQIRKLEESLDCALFVREGRQVSLTEDGERLLATPGGCWRCPRKCGKPSADASAWT